MTQRFSNDTEIKGLTEPFLHKQNEAEHDSSSKCKSTLLNVTSFIIVCEFCERLAYYGFAGSLVLFFQTQLNFSNANADTQYALWSGVCYITPLLGGWVADAKLGRYKSIMVFCLIYLLGLCLVVGGSSPKTATAAMIFPAMYVVALGTGGIKPNVSTFGAEQFDDSNPEDVEEKEAFFGWFYWSINLGSLVSFSVVSFICQYGISWLGGKDWGFFVGFSIPAISMGLAIITFLIGTPRYKTIPTESNQPDALAVFFGILFEAGWTNCKKKLVAGRHWTFRAAVSEGGSYQKQQVEDAQKVLSLLPFLLLTVPYWAIYAQMSTAFQNQGCQMNLQVGSGSIPVSALNIFDTLAIIVLVPVFNKIIYPACKYLKIELTMLKKIGLGFFVAAAAVACAGFLEIARKRMAPEDGPYPIGKDSISSCQSIEDYMPSAFQLYYESSSAPKPLYCTQIFGCDDLNSEGLLDLSCISCENIPQSSPVNVLWQTFQFLLVGTSEILTSITGMEFFYSQAPVSMRSICSSLNLLTTALGSWITIPLISLVNINKGSPWISSDLNTGHLEYYFFLLAGIMVLDLMAFVIVSKGYEYQSPSADELQITHLPSTLRARASSEAWLPENPVYVRHRSCTESGQPPIPRSRGGSETAALSILRR